MLVEGAPDRVQARIVDGQPLRQHDRDRRRPRCVGETLDVACGCVGIGGRHRHRGLEASGIDGAVGVEVAVVGGVDLLCQRGVERRHGVGERAGDDQVDVDAFPVHVAQPALGVEVVDAWLVRRARLADASLQRALAAADRRGVRRRLAHLALVRHRLDAQEVATLRLTAGSTQAARPSGREARGRRIPGASRCSDRRGCPCR